MQSTSFRAITIFFLLSFAFACQKGERSRDASPQQSYHSWQYPVKLGDTRAKVHNLLGNAVRATSQLEEHPLSGVTLWFDADDPVTKLTFVGEAIVLYSPDPMDQIPSDRPVLRGLSPKMDDETFRRILGSPTKQAIERSKSFQELHCI